MTDMIEAAPLSTERFEFYGCGIEVACHNAALLEEVRRDFAYFRRPGGSCRFRIEMRLQDPPYASLPSLPAAFLTPRNVCYRQGQTMYVDFFGRALAVHDRETGLCVVYSTDEDLIHEVVYLHVLSTVGQALDRQGLHRVHALGVGYRDRAALLLLPSGGGKSTMALELMRQPGFTLLGEDTPLIDRRGCILPFPLRLGVRPGSSTGVPEEHLRTKRRMEFDPKTLIDIEYFHDRLATPAQAVKPGLILVGQRNLGPESRIVPLSRRGAMKALVKYMVVGLGVYQGLEFLLERGIGDLAGMGGTVASRFYNASRLVMRAPAYRFVLGRNIHQNTDLLLDLLRRDDDSLADPR
jgi:hypothetical protein